MREDRYRGHRWFQIGLILVYVVLYLLLLVNIWPKGS